MHVILHGDAKKDKASKEGIYILQTNLVNEKPHWLQENGGSAIWADENVKWSIGYKINLGGIPCGIYSPDNVENPLQALTWKYAINDNKWIESKDIVVSKRGNIHIRLKCLKSGLYMYVSRFACF